MTPRQQQLVQDVVSLTGAEMPDWSAADAPTLQQSAAPELYLIGVIGGKDVGKSSLVNAILGQDIAAVSAHGEGTSRALAYVHEADAESAAALLEANVPGAFDLVRHTIDDARNRVLLDLPDVDSVWDGHVDLTRRMLRSMLFPVWVQSIEKYADRVPLALLARVATGNAPQNFVFVLTKADQLAKRHGRDAVDELKADFALRAARACQIETRPAVFAIDGLMRRGFDLDALRQSLLEKRSAQSLGDARRRAEQQQARTLNVWLRQQRIDEQLAAARRSLEEAEAMLSARVIEPLIERIAARPVSPSLIEPAVRARIAHWPIVSAIDAVLAPVLTVFRARSEPLSEQPLAGRQIAQHVRGVFADLTQRQPRVVDLYDQNKLWETDVADRAAAALEERFTNATAARQLALREETGRPSILVTVPAFFLTIGAALWFPIVEPVLEIVLQQDLRHFTTATLLLVIQIIGATYLVRSVGFLAIYFVALWIWLRWRTTRRAERAILRTARTEGPGDELADWAGQLLAPLRRHVERLQSLAGRIAALQQDHRAAA